MVRDSWSSFERTEVYRATQIRRHSRPESILAHSSRYAVKKSPSPKDSGKRKEVSPHLAA